MYMHVEPMYIENMYRSHFYTSWICQCLLIHHNNYVGAVNSYGLTPLGLAVSEGRLNIVEYLITKMKVDVNGT